ncbi:MAG: polyribonucleotide nucleotidyltransferase [bacterium]
MEFTGELEIGGRELTLQSGKIARQADGAVQVKYGDTVVLSTACIDDPKDLPFFPLTVEYQEMAYSAGKIPGGFFKREGKPSNLETVKARLTDRPIRPMFPDDYRNEVQIISTVFSAESKNLPDIMSINGASAALMIADCPFDGPLGAVRMGRRDGDLIVNPSHDDVEEGDLDLIVVGTDDAITMVESSADEVPESVLLDAMDVAHDNIREIIDLQHALIKQCQKPQTEYTTPDLDEDLAEKIRTEGRDRIKEAVFVEAKQEREEALDEVEDELEEELIDEEDIEDPEELEILEYTFEEVFEEVKKDIVKKAILEDGKRIGGRDLDEIRPINVEAGHLPRTHGSALFTRGETQALATVTLGTPSETQRVDNIYEEAEKRFLLHYNFPPFCVGECRRMTGPGRREIGHGLMAESAIRSVLPDEDDWPYTTRVVSEILESNGSSSMATVCAGSMALMDAGVPLDRPVSGISMGLMMGENGDYEILTDILGDEDHMGDMDFKVAGTEEGVTSLQLDIKISGISRDILEEALSQAREARMEVLNSMAEAISEPRESISEHAPRLYQLSIPKDKIRDLIGPGGKNIKKIIEETGAEIDVEDDGTIFVGAEDQEAGEEARKRVEQYTQEVEVGETYEGEVVNTTDFGAFVEILPGQEGLVHISELADDHVNETTDVVEEGDIVTVVCTDITDKGIELSKRQADKETQGAKA